MKLKIITFLLITSATIHAQELFVVTEPASNMATGSIGFRANNYFMQIDSTKKTSYHLMPEIMVGVTKKFMAHIALISSNRKNSLEVEGVTLYGKYKFLSKDEVHKHFRMATFGRYSYNSSPIHMQENSLLMHNSGYEYGVVATQLLHKTAYSVSTSIQKATNTNTVKYPYNGLQQSFNYSASVGHLFYPKSYTSYKQTNINAMLEFVGQYNMGNQHQFIDMVPSLQFIIKSVARIDVAYRTQISGNLQRSFSRGVLLKFEYNIFNAFK